MIQKVLILMAIGAVGTLCRFALSGIVQHLTGARFPWGTLAVNVLGCLLFGVVWASANERHLMLRETAFLILSGFMGAFTTFSSYAFETMEMIHFAQYGKAAANVAIQHVLGFLGIYLGVVIGSRLL